MRQAVGGDSVLEGGSQRVLSHHLVERCRAIFASRYNILFHSTAKLAKIFETAPIRTKKFPNPTTLTELFVGFEQISPNYLSDLSKNCQIICRISTNFRFYLLISKLLPTRPPYLKILPRSGFGAPEALYFR